MQKVDHLTMEFTNPGAGEMSIFRQLPESTEIDSDARTSTGPVTTLLSPRRPKTPAPDSPLMVVRWKRVDRWWSWTRVQI